MIRTIDCFAVGYGRGHITCLPSDPTTIVDTIPADMVVNAVIVAMAAHANQAANDRIYHVGSSVSNPVESPWLQNSFFRYSTTRPLIDRNSNPVIVGKITPLPSVESFQRRMNIRYLLPLKGLQVLNTACCQYFQKFYLEQLRKSRFVVRLIELYEPYLFYKGVLDDMNTEKLRRAAAEESSGVEANIFYFDPKGINWDDYFINTHIPGVVKTIIKK